MLSNTFLVLSALTFFAAVLQHAGLVTTIRAHYHEYYERLGKPPAVIVTPLNWGASFSFLAYVVFGDFIDDDVPAQVLDAFVASRRLYLATLGLAVAGIVATFF